MKKELGIVDKRIKEYTNEHHSFEVKALIKNGMKYFTDVHVIIPENIYYKYNRQNRKAGIIHNGKDISNLSHLIVRGTKGIESEIATLAKSLQTNGSFIYDSKYRFNAAKPGKLLSTVDRHKNGIGSTSYLSFNLQNSRRLVDSLSQEEFPLLTKPIGGSKGRGVKLISNKEEAKKHIDKFYNRVRKSALLFQKYIDIVDEFRVFVVYGTSLGVVKKIAAENKITANAAKGGKFIKVDEPKVEIFAVANCYSEAILGIDIARTSDNQLHVIEANFSPQWKSFETATNINVANKILEYGLQK